MAAAVVFLPKECRRANVHDVSWREVAARAGSVDAGASVLLRVDDDVGEGGGAGPPHDAPRVHAVGLQLRDDALENRVVTRERKGERESETESEREGGARE